MKYSIVIFLFSCCIILKAQPEIYYEPEQEIKVGTEIYFEAKNIDLENDAVSWDFGDGFKTGNYGGRTYVHCYKFPGEYSVKLIVNDETADSVSLVVGGSPGKLIPRAENGLIAYLPFDNSLNDVSGKNNNAVFGGSSISYLQGISGNCIDVSDSNFVRIPSFNSLNGAGEFTLSFWAKRKNTNGGDRIYLIDKAESFRVWFRSNGDSYQGFVFNETSSGQADTWYKNIKNTSWHHYMLVYDGSFIRLFLDGSEIKGETRCPAAFSGNIRNVSGDLFIGASASGTYNFEGYIDELKIYNRALSEQELNSRFEIIHADFNSRYSQKIITIIPPDISENSENRLYAVISGNKGFNSILADKNNLSDEEIILLNNFELPADSYTLSVQIKNEQGDVLDEIVETFNKSYNGEPAVGIDENNAVRLNGELFFPVTPFHLNNENVADWGSSGYINCLFGQGFWPQNYTSAGWGEYIGLGENANLKIIGPGGNFTNGIPSRNVGENELASHISVSAVSNDMLAYTWIDEPELGGKDISLSPQTMRAWTNRTHKYDTERPVLLNLVGPYINYDDNSYNADVSNGFFPRYNENVFGKKTFVVDFYSMDYYPIDWAAPHSRGAKMSVLTSILDKIKYKTYGLVPYSSFVETCNIRENDAATKFDPTNWDPSPEMLKMLIWINVVHGVKALSWFPYHSGTPAVNYPVMREFVEQITDLTPVVLGPEIEPNISVETNAEARIDFMLREYNNKTYLFAVRVSELDDQPNSDFADSSRNPDGYPDPEQDYPVTATFSFAEILSGDVKVYDENRSLNIIGSKLTDEFKPYDVHIYEIENALLQVEKDNTVLEFSLSQNYPNPFNPSTIINYSLPAGRQELPMNSNVTLRIYDILGREVITLVNEQKPAGTYSIQWNGTNSAGVQVGSGIYFYQLKTNNGFVETKKMMLLR